MYDDQQLHQLLSDPATQRKGFEALVRRFSEPLYWQIRHIVLTHEDANDVLQNTFLKAWNGLSSFQGDSQFITWLSRIAINESLDFLRRNKHALTCHDEDLSVANNLMADPYFDGNETEAMLQEAIASLPGSATTPSGT